ncbi:amidohydrolase [Dokdonia sinensis]|uniref:Amidohydrolase n=1 Tax=Dokdonia sinensis TaxID=2479847 RepID=A0A3M0G616_9FLAO|nr:amidohydrolase [Dokdonia sinensis]RMB60481.1 amidohydrolase [Dokdonia sinensis]
MRLLLTFFFVSIVFSSCETPKESADLLVINANLHTVDDATNGADAFAVKDGKFIAVGNTAYLQEKFSATETVDASGKTILPGLIDGHCHFYGLGQNLQVANLVGTTSWDAVVEKVSAFAKANPNATAIRGRGWDQNDWEVKEFPTKDKLDELFPEIPVALERVDGHAYLVNQKGLDLAGITAETKVEGGEIVKVNGKVTGVLIDNPQSLVDAVLPQMSREGAVNALMQAQELCFSFGLTTVNDAGLNRETIELIDSLQTAGDLNMRVYAMVSNTEENLEHYLKTGKVKTDYLNVRSVKVYGDGALGSRGAALREPYSDKDGHFGAMVTPVSKIQELSKRIANAGFQMNTHAIGDSANIVVLRAYEEALKNVEDPRWKVEHAQIVSLEDFDYFNDKILPSVQPTHATSDMNWAEDRVGAERIKGAYAFKDLLNKSGRVILGTDFPVEQVSPFYTFYAAVARKDLKQYPEGGYQMENALSREETLKGMTIWPAYSNFEEAEKGSITTGKFADFIIMDEDIMSVDEDKIPNLTVGATYVNGEKVFSKS